MKDEIVDRCDGLPLGAKTLAEVISIQLGKKEYWSDSRVKKVVSLRLDKHDCISNQDAMRKLVEALPGVGRAIAGPGYNEITALGMCNPVEVARELGKLWHTELISVERQVVE